MPIKRAGHPGRGGPLTLQQRSRPRPSFHLCLSGCSGGLAGLDAVDEALRADDRRLASGTHRSGRLATVRRPHAVQRQHHLPWQLCSVEAFSRVQR